METLTLEAPPVVEIPEPAAVNEIVRYEPPSTALEPVQPQQDSEIVDATWRIVDDAPSNQAAIEPWTPSATDNGWTPYQPQAAALPEPKPYTLNQQMADEWQRNGWTFERPTQELSVGEQMAQPAPRTQTQPQRQGIASMMPVDRQQIWLEMPDFAGWIFSQINDFLSFLTFGFAGGSNTAPRYTPAKRVLFVTRLDFGETLGAYLVGQGLPLQVEGEEKRRGNMPEYKFSISANHLKWGLRLMRDYGCEPTYDKERELWEVLPV